MELRQLRYFVAVVDAGSVSHACASLGVAQPTLSQAMSTLESELGTALLTRSQRGVAPTDGGDALYRHGLRILRLIDELPDVVRQRRQSTAGRVRLGMPISIGTMVAPALIAQLRVTYPDISLEIDEHMAANYGASHLLNDRMDLSVLLNNESLASEIVSTPFLHERF